MDLYLTSVQYLVWSGITKSLSSAGLGSADGILIGLENQLDYNSAIVIGILYISFVCDMKDVNN